MNKDEQLTLARMDFELHASVWPLPQDVTAEYISVIHPSRTIDRSLLTQILSEYIGAFEDPTALARTLTAQSFIGDDGVSLNAWPFCHIDWRAAAQTLEDSIRDSARGAIVRVHRIHYFTPSAE